MWQRMKAKLRGCKKSLTIWFNSAAGTALVALPYVQENLPQLQSYLPDSTFRYLMGGVVAVNLVLRFKTSQPLEGK